MDTTENQWIGTYKIESFFDINGNIISRVAFTWDKIGSQWINNGKSENSFDANNNPTLKIYYNWDIATAEWVEYERWLYGYDSYHNQTLITWYNSDRAGYENLMNKDYYYYSSHSISSAVPIKEQSLSFNIYPNPANETLNIQISNNQQANIKIFDISGKLLKTANIKESNTAIPVNVFPKGIYFIELEINNQSYVQKILIH